MAQEVRVKLLDGTYDTIRLDGRGGLNDTPKNPRRGEPDVVLGSEFAPILREWVDKYEEERPRRLMKPSTRDDDGRHKFGSPVFISAYAWLEAETGIGNRRLRGIANGEFKYVSLTHVDKIVQALGHPEYLRNGTVNIIPSPYWSQEQWIEYMEERGCV